MRKLSGHVSIAAGVAVVAALLTGAPANAAVSGLPLAPTASSASAVSLTSAVPSAAASTRAGSHKILYPTRQSAAASRLRLGASAAISASGSGKLTYHGGVDNIGVTTGAPKVYLIFWGSQWGTSSTDASSNLTFTGDSSGMAPRLQQLFKGIGTGNETWSGVMTQYCEGVAVGATSCPSGSLHVGYPTGGALAGVWYDSSAAAPSQATDHQIGVEALAGVVHFANTTAAQNRNAQYVVVSPTGTFPGGFNTTAGNFCAWHDYNGDTTLVGGAVASSYGDFAFTNLPYITDLGASCGANYVNAGAAGTLDGVTIVEGHEYAETVTDQNPSGGWWDAAGYENGDKCAWVGTGGTGGAQNITFGTAGTFAMQGSYSNDSSSCLVSHAVVVNGVLPNTITVTAPPAQSTAAGVAISPIAGSAVDSNVALTSFTWSGAGLPAGVTINSASGAISGTPTKVGTGTVTLTATDSTLATGSATFTWTVLGNTVTVTSPGNQSSPRGSAIATLTIHATDSNSAITAFTWSATGLPAGLTLNTATGAITGTPTGTGTSTVALKATDNIGSVGSVSFTWTVISNTITVTSPGAQSSPGGSSIATRTIHATDSNAAITAFTWSATGLPTGLSIGSTTGIITGTPTKSGTYSVTVKATDSTGASGSVTFSWTITATTVTVTSPGTQTSTHGVPITALTIHATDSNSAITTFVWSVSSTGPLPAGLTINSSTGVISGTPTKAGSYSVTITAKDLTGASSSVSFTWKVL